MRRARRLDGTYVIRDTRYDRRGPFPPETPDDVRQAHIVDPYGMGYPSAVSGDDATAALTVGGVHPKAES